MPNPQPTRHDRFVPQLIQRNGRNKPSILYLTPELWLRLPATQTNVAELLAKTYANASNLNAANLNASNLKAANRGWMDVERLYTDYVKITKRKIQVEAVRGYANKLHNRIVSLLKEHGSSVTPLMERSAGFGFRITTELLVIDATDTATDTDTEPFAVASE